MARTAPESVPLTDFDLAVARVVKAIPEGHVSSYSQVAQRAGSPGAARRVATALKRLTGVPWWRVVQAAGTLAPEVAGEQARRLRKEGVEVRGRRIAVAAPEPLDATGDGRRRSAAAPTRRRAGAADGRESVTATAPTRRGSAAADGRKSETATDGRPRDTRRR